MQFYKTYKSIRIMRTSSLFPFFSPFKFNFILRWAFHFHRWYYKSFSTKRDVTANKLRILQYCGGR